MTVDGDSFGTIRRAGLATVLGSGEVIEEPGSCADSSSIEEPRHSEDLSVDWLDGCNSKCRMSSSSIAIPLYLSWW